METNNIPTGYIESKYVLPVYEHVKVGKKTFTRIKCFVAYQVVYAKEKNRGAKYLRKAVLKVKVLTGNDAGSVYDGKYIYATDGAYDEEFMLMFANENLNDKVYMYERDGEHLLNDMTMKDLWIHNFDENGKYYSSSRISLSEYTKVDELNEIQAKYNEGTQKFIDKEELKQLTVDTIF